jgi:hypothetical protein
MAGYAGELTKVGAAIKTRCVVRRCPVNIKIGFAAAISVCRVDGWQPGQPRQHRIEDRGFRR